MRRLCHAFALAAALSLGVPVVAQTQFRPVTATFTGKSALLLPPAIALDINGAGTIEFWVAARWDGDLGYDPGLIAYSGPKGPRFAIHMQADAKALGIYAGSNYQAVPYDFSDGSLHYVAVVNVAATILVYVDGQERAVLGFGYADLPATDFSIGSISKLSPFIGEIGQIRIWKEPLDVDVLNRFSLAAIEASGPNAHPFIDSLVGASMFANPETGGFVIVGSTEESNTTALDDSSIVDRDLNPVR